ncbi:transposase [Pleurocapsa sp. FMAR1]|uniref:transposase n=1 Tax=Pleurocapsa sp. FMAR1 TaxID=3040204 RepID=UPI0029C92CE0|nr:transposase [Pleurocapsa sp. FMAR1]
MTSHPPFHHQLLQYLGQHTNYSDYRHLITLSWMVVGVLMSQSLHLTEWEPFVVSRANKAESYQKRWSRFLQNSRIDEEKLYLPLVMAAIEHWSDKRIYLALDTTVLWNQYCMIHLSIICGGRAIPFLWQVEEHKSATISFTVYRKLLRKASWLLRHHDDVMLLADRGFAHQGLLKWLNKRTWHYCLRIPSDTLIHGVHRWRACPVSQLRTVKGEAKMYHQVRLWESGIERVNLAHAYPMGAAEPWTVITDETPTLNTFWQYGLRFRVEELFLDSKSGVFGLADSRLRTASKLSRLYLVVAIAILYSTVMGTTVQLSGLRTQVDVHCCRGLSYLKIGLRWLRGTIYKNRQLLKLLPLPYQDRERCFASHRAEADYYERLLFSRVRSLKCSV